MIRFFPALTQPYVTTDAEWTCCGIKLVSKIGGGYTVVLWKGYCIYHAYQMAAFPCYTIEGYVALLSQAPPF